MLIIYSKEGKQNSWTVRIPVFGSCKKFKYRLLTLRNTDKIPTTQAKLVTIFEKRWLTTYIYMNVFFVWHDNKAFITDGKIRGFPFFLETPKRPSLWVAKSGGFPPKNMGNMFHKHPRGEIIIIENKRSFPSRNDQNLNHSQEEANFFEESPP